MRVFTDRHNLKRATLSLQFDGKNLILTSPMGDQVIVNQQDYATYQGFAGKIDEYKAVELKDGNIAVIWNAENKKFLEGTTVD